MASPHPCDQGGTEPLKLKNSAEHAEWDLLKGSIRNDEWICDCSAMMHYLICSVLSLVLFCRRERVGEKVPLFKKICLLERERFAIFCFTL